MRVRRAIVAREFSDLFGPPKSGWGLALPGFAVLPLVLVRQAKKAVANKKAAEEAAQVRTHTGCVASPS
jgi:hypothetical protein